MLLEDGAHTNKYVMNIDEDHFIFHIVYDTGKLEVLFLIQTLGMAQSFQKIHPMKIQFFPGIFYPLIKHLGGATASDF